MDSQSNVIGLGLYTLEAKNIIINSIDLMRGWRDPDGVSVLPSGEIVYKVNYLVSEDYCKKFRRELGIAVRKLVRTTVDNYKIACWNATDAQVRGCRDSDKLLETGRRAEFKTTLNHMMFVYDVLRGDKDSKQLARIYDKDMMEQMRGRALDPFSSGKIQLLQNELAELKTAYNAKRKLLQEEQRLAMKNLETYWDEQIGAVQKKIDAALAAVN